MRERWKSVVGFGEEKYVVSSLGRVKSIINNRLLKPCCSGSGRYCRVNLCFNGIVKTCSVHRLVLEAFKGLCPEGMEACHSDGNSINNAVNNLRWDTRKNNNFDKRKHGTHPSGERNPRAKYTAKDVLRIRALRKRFHKLGSISRTLNLPVSFVNSVVHCNAWRCVSK